MKIDIYDMRKMAEAVAADLETCKNAMAQWVYNERRVKGKNYKIISISVVS